MVSRSPLLLDRLVPHRYVIECPRNGGIMRSLSSDAALQHGLNPSANIVDELHAHKSAELYTALTTGTGAREQPFTLWITTAGVAGEGILAELFESMFTGSGELEDRGSLLIYRDRTNGTLIYWYGAPRDADIEDPAVWYAANPVSWLHDGKYLGAQFARLRARGALLESEAMRPASASCARPSHPKRHGSTSRPAGLHTFGEKPCQTCGRETCPVDIRARSMPRTVRRRYVLLEAREDIAG
jgi:hypothetical protein